MRFLFKHPFGQSLLVLAASYLLFELGIGYLLPVLGVESAPVPDSVILQYMATVAVGVLLWVSDNEERWSRFKEPIHDVMVREDRRGARGALLVAIPVAVALLTWGQVKPSVSAPPALRSIHPAPPSRINFRGTAMELSGLENPLRHEGDMDEHYETGKDIYYRNCLPCHGDALNGQGHYAHAFNPAPLDLGGTIAQLTESFVFWRIAKGGPGLPVEGTPWHSAMPAWEDLLTEDEIWAVTIFLYRQTNRSPRTWEEAGGEGGEH